MESSLDDDKIQISELEQALLSERLELIEDYPEDPRGHSHLLLGFTDAGLPIHTVCVIHEGTLVIITLYRPDQKLWQNYRVRKGKK